MIFILINNIINIFGDILYYLSPFNFQPFTLKKPSKKIKVYLYFVYFYFICYVYV